VALVSLTPEQSSRLDKSEIIWLATVRPDGSPHLAPLWFVWWSDRVYVCTPAATLKSRNMLLNRKIALALEDGITPVIIEGEARRLDNIPQEVDDLFLRKYDWQIFGDETNDAVFEIVPAKVLSW
jgi:hypothetical protein